MSGEDPIQTSAEALEADAMPRAHSVHTDPDRGNERTPSAEESARPKKPKSAAEWAYQRMILYIRNFEEQLDDDHEVAMAFAGGATGVMKIEGMGYFDPDILTFYGSDPTGARSQLVQHVSQLSVMLRAVPKSVSQEAPRRIGFRLVEDLESAPEPPQTG